MTEQKTITAKLDCALAMLSQSARISASSRKEITAVLQDVRNEVDLLVSENHTLKTHHLRVEADTVVKSLRERVDELISLVEQQASYIHNNIKPVEKSAEVPFLAKEQPDRAFGIYTVNNEWAAYKVKDNVTITEDQLKRMVESEAKLLGHQQLGHSNFQVVVVVSGGNSLRFSLRQALGFNGLQQLFGLAPRQPNNGQELDFGAMLGSMNHSPIRY